MARKKSRKKVSHRRRRRVGAISGGMSNTFQLIAGGVASVFAGKLVDMLPVIKDQPEKTKNIVKAVLPIGVGMALPKLVRGSGMIGSGMIVGGGIKLVGTLAPKLIGAVDYYANKPTPAISGYQTNTAGNYISGFQTNTAGNYIAGLNKVAAIIEAAD
jgi:hypothetical protein